MATREHAMTRRKGKKKLTKFEVTIREIKATDFPQAPGLIALMYAGNLARSVPARTCENVADGYD